MKTKALISCAVTAQLISAFVFTAQIVQFPPLPLPKISRFQLSSETVQIGLCLTGSEFLKSGFLALWLILFISQNPQKLTKKQRKKMESEQRKREQEMAEIAAELLRKQEREKEKQKEKERKAEQKDSEEKENEGNMGRIEINEPLHEKNNNLHRRKQSRRSAMQ